MKTRNGEGAWSKQCVLGLILLFVNCFHGDFIEQKGSRSQDQVLVHNICKTFLRQRDKLTCALETMILPPPVSLKTTPSFPYKVILNL